MQTAERRKQWTVMVYLAGQNRLFDEMVYALKEMKRAAKKKDSDVALLAEFSSEWVFPKDVKGMKLPTPRRFHLYTDEEHPAGSVVKNFIKVPQEEPYPNLIEELAQFIWWGVKNYEAQRYMVVFSGDGGGVNSDFLPSLIKPGRKLRAADLKKVFSKVNSLAYQHGQKDIIFDIVGFDSCMMSMLEIAHVLKGHANYMVGSQGNEDDLGWPFADILQPLTDHPEMTAEQMAINTVDKYNTYYLDYAIIAEASASLSAFLVEMMDTLTAAVKNFVDASLKILPRDCKKQTALQRIFVSLYVSAHWEAQTYREDQFVDLYDFCDRFVKQAETMMDIHGQKLSDLQPVVDACKRIQTLLCKTEECDDAAGKAVITSCTVGAKYQYSHGISIYFPWNKIHKHYYPGDEYEDPAIDPDEFAKNTGWSKFLQRYIDCSQRPQRYWSKSSLTDQTRKLIEDLKIRKDPPEGKGIGLEPATAKNPPTEWGVSPCVEEPLR